MFKEILKNNIRNEDVVLNIKMRTHGKGIEFLKERDAERICRSLGLYDDTPEDFKAYKEVLNLCRNIENMQRLESEEMSIDPLMAGAYTSVEKIDYSVEKQKAFDEIKKLLKKFDIIERFHVPFGSKENYYQLLLEILHD